jgi:hypothetical protein
MIPHIHIRTGEHPAETIVTDEDGKPLEVTSVSVLLTPERTLASATFFNAEIDVKAELVDLDRLEAAEQVCKRARFLLKHAPQPITPGEHGLRMALAAALDAWEVWGAG